MVSTFDGSVEFSGSISIPLTNISAGDEWVFDFIDTVPDSAVNVEVNVDMTFQLGVGLGPPPSAPSVFNFVSFNADVVDLVDFDKIIPDVNAGAEIRLYTFNNLDEIIAFIFQV